MHYFYKNSLSELEQLAKDIELFSENYALDLKTAYTINLCIEEVFANIVSYGFNDQLEHKIRVDLNLSDESIEIIITDDGKPFNPITEVPPPSLDEPLLNRSPGGLGIFFIKEMMDKLDYQHLDNQNIFKMVKLRG